MKYFFLTLIAFTLTACGFTPMHAGASGSAIKDISVNLLGGEDLGDEQAGFFVAQRLRDRIGVTDKPRYRLDITPTAQRSAIGITDRDVASRYDTRLTLSYRLTDMKSGKLLDNGSVKSVTTFGAPTDSYGVVAADISSKQQAAKEVADRLINILAAHYAANPPAP
jgi:LPS-assembly lipoprotein